MKVNPTTTQQDRATRDVFAAHVRAASITQARGGELHLTTDRGPVVVYLSSPEERAALAEALASKDAVAQVRVDPPVPKVPTVPAEPKAAEPEASGEDGDPPEEPPVAGDLEEPEDDGEPDDEEPEEVPGEGQAEPEPGAMPSAMERFA